MRVEMPKGDRESDRDRQIHLGVVSQSLLVALLLQSSAPKLGVVAASHSKNSWKDDDQQKATIHRERACIGFQFYEVSFFVFEGEIIFFYFFKNTANLEKCESYKFQVSSSKEVKKRVKYCSETSVLQYIQIRAPARHILELTLSIVNINLQFTPLSTRNYN